MEHKKITSQSLHIFDNGGESLDRYTVVFPNGDIYGCSEEPEHPLGVATFSHNADDGHEEGIDPYTYEGKADFVGNAQADPDWLGKELSFQEAPRSLQNFIDGMFSDHYQDKYIYPLVYADSGQQIDRVITTCPPCRMENFRQEINEESISEERADYVVARLMDLIGERYWIRIAGEYEEADVKLKI